MAAMRTSIEPGGSAWVTELVDDEHEQQLTQLFHRANRDALFCREFCCAQRVRDGEQELYFYRRTVDELVKPEPIDGMCSVCASVFATV